MCGSFVLLWGWFLAQKAAERDHAPLPILWHAALILALVLLAFITIRRIKRVQRALRGEDEDGNPTPMYPMFGTPPGQKPDSEGKPRR